MEVSAKNAIKRSLGYNYYKSLSMLEGDFVRIKLYHQLGDQLPV